ncbi:transcriptional regulator [Hoeflea sp. IMCC20628]|uniref:GntR family transcriptional regulator n=1 Tax=Hoeflea sp. IMCC20628 TaxID=1620421 RepID=UPI00063B0433|nr:GntR family transcriptional regulator [Hoeflea sp. IMCC20628]AKH99682.1 transcriptional regulator [Hoeflea sp. IMCC20628]
MNITTLNPQSLADRSYGTVRQAILTGRLAPDSTWSDRELCEMFDLSRTPVREALLRLQTEQLVQIVPRKGTRILPLRLEDVRDIHQLTKALELEAALLVARNYKTLDDLSPIRICVEAMETALDAEDRDAWAQADTACHFAVVDSCGNKRLASIYHAQRGLTDRARYFVLHLREMPVQSTIEHRQMYEALVARDLRKLEVAYRHHWERTTEEMLTLIARVSPRNSGSAVNHQT